MKQDTSMTSGASGLLSRVPGVGPLRDLGETWAFLRDVTRELTCAEELGWPEWRQWF